MIDFNVDSWKCLERTRWSMFYNIKNVVLFLKLETSLILVRNYGNSTYDLVNKYNGLLSVSTLRKLEKLSLKCDKASLDIKILITCK